MGEGVVRLKLGLTGQAVSSQADKPWEPLRPMRPAIRLIRRRSKFKVAASLRISFALLARPRHELLWELLDTGRDSSRREWQRPVRYVSGVGPQL